jgi:hypothetical protein
MFCGIHFTDSRRPGGWNPNGADNKKPRPGAAVAKVNIMAERINNLTGEA